jgi:hypothetical protein
LEDHVKDYKTDAWKRYTLSELGNFVHNLTKRATHRKNVDKATKDIDDARNYLDMMSRKIQITAKELGIDF